MGCWSFFCAAGPGNVLILRPSVGLLEPLLGSGPFFRVYLCFFLATSFCLFCVPFAPLFGRHFSFLICVLWTSFPLFNCRNKKPFGYKNLAVTCEDVLGGLPFAPFLYRVFLLQVSLFFFLAEGFPMTPGDCVLSFFFLTFFTFFASLKTSPPRYRFGVFLWFFSPGAFIPAGTSRRRYKMARAAPPFFTAFLPQRVP